MASMSRGCDSSLGRRVSLLLLLLCLLSVVFSSEAPEGVYNSDTRSRRSLLSLLYWSQGSGPLVEWLDHLRVDIPDQTFEAGLLKVHIEGMHCTHFSVQDIDSSLDERANTSLRVQVVQVAATCHGNYKSTGVEGTIDARLTRPTDQTDAVEWTVAVVDNPNTTTIVEPAAIQTQDCETALQIADLHFSGSLSAKLIQLFRSQIEHHANAAIERQICPVIEAKADPLLSSYLQQAMHWLRPYYDGNQNSTENDALIAIFRSDMSVQEQDSTTTTMDFARELPVLTNTLTAMNAFVEKHLNRGFLPFVPNYYSEYLTPSTTMSGDSIPTVVQCGGFLYGVNGVLREVLQNWGDGDSEGGSSWTLPVPPLHLHWVLPRYAEIGLHLERVTVSGEGLHQWRNLTVMQPQQGEDDSSFRTILGTPGNVSVTVHMVVNVSSVPGGMFHADPLTESFIVQVNATSLEAELDLDVELDRDRFQRVTVGRLVDVLQKLMMPDHDDLSLTPDAACLLDPIRALTAGGLSTFVDLSGLSIQPAPSRSNNSHDSPGSPVMKNDQLERDLDTLLSNIVQLFLNRYPPLVTAAISGLVRGPVQEKLNAFFASSIDIPPNLTANCSAEGPSSVEPHWMNFTQIRPLQRLNALLSEKNTLAKINQYMDCTTSLISQAIEEKLLTNVANTPGHQDDSLQSVLDSNLPRSSLRLRRLQINHTGSIRQFEFLAPTTDGIHLESGISLRGNNSALRPQICGVIDLEYVPLNLSVTVNVTVYLDEIDWTGGSILRIDSNVFKHMALTQLLSQGQCLFLPADQIGFYSSKTRLGLFQSVVNATIVLEEGSQTIMSFDSENYPHIQIAASSFFVWFVNTIHDGASSFARAGVSHASSQCEGGSYDTHRDDDEEEEKSVGVNANTIFLILAAIYMFAQPAILLMKRPREASGREEDGGGGGNENGDLMEPLLHPRYSDETSRIQQTATGAPVSLMFNPKVPETARHLVPMLVLITIAMLVASNLTTGASVYGVISLEDRSLRVPSLFNFGLYNTAKEMLEAKILVLFGLVVGFSGIWPYAKLLLMLAAWIVPESTLSKKRRGELLLKLDALSKFSLVDTYVLVVMVVAFRYHLELIGDSFLDVYVAPKSGFYGFLVATSASLVIGHVMVFYHRRTELHLESDDLNRDSLFNHEFAMYDGSRRRLSQNFKKVLVVVLASLIVFLGVGITQKSFTFEFGGLAGLALGDGRRSSYSLLSLGAAIPRSVEAPPGIAVYILQAAFYFYAVVTPFAALFFLLLILICPLTLRLQCYLLTLAEIANAWSAIEVFALSIIAALLEISTFASFIIGHRCDMINEILKDYDDGDVETCYTVKSTVTWKAVFLVLGVILNSCWVSFILRLVHLSFHERIEPDEAGASIVQWMAARCPASWIVESDDADVSNDDAGPPIFSEEMHQETYGFDEAWKEAAERDPSWKEWKEATSVT